MISMKTSEQVEMCLHDRNPYGYGTRICLDAEQCRALGITEPLPVGSHVAVEAKTVVVRGSEELEPTDKGGKPEVRVELQITDLGLQPVGEKDVAGKLYDDKGGG